MLYPWHPWYQQIVLTQKPTRHRGSSVYLCKLEICSPESGPVFIPRWMFEANECALMSISPTPTVSCESLRALRELITAQRATSPSMIEAESSGQPGQGESNDDIIEPRLRQATDSICAKASHTLLERAQPVPTGRSAQTAGLSNGQRARRTAARKLAAARDRS
jgi:hypothetical protein